MTTPQELKQIVSEGLLSFPVTDFDEQGDFRADTYAERLEWLAPYGASACSSPAARANSSRSRITTTRTSCDGNRSLQRQGADSRRRRRPDPRGDRVRQEAERHGANGILLMPHYLTEACQEGIAAHAKKSASPCRTWA
jgi:Dihydrodipicolinate synthase/N-acetylneuraminate lyase